MKKELTKDKQWLKISAICIAVYLLIAIPLTIWIDCITWHWFWFGFFVVYIPLAFFYMYFWSGKRVKPNEEQKKTAALNLCKYILLFWFYDLLYMAIFNQWLVLEYIFGIIAVIIIFSNLIKAFLSGIKSFKWILPFDLLCGVGLSVYLIYRMPNETLQTIVLTVVAALYGGLLTLVGVAWTIKSEAKNRQDDFDKREQERKEEEKKKARPIFTFNMVYHDLDTVEGKRICLDENQERFEFEVLAQLENSEHSSFKVERVYHDNQWWDTLGNNVILPNKCVYFDFNFTEDVNNLFMEIKDGLDNAYYYEIKVLCLGLIARLRPHLSDKKLHTIRELKEITLEEINERIKKAEA